jgi:molybdate transport system substrate-binding protein
MTMGPKIAAMCTAGALTAMANVANAAEVTVIASTAMREVLEELVPMFERSSGHKVTVNFMSGSVLPVKIKEGERSDLVVTTPATIDDLIAAGRLVRKSQVDFVRSAAGVAVKSGAPKPDISTTEAFKNALLAARSVGISQGPSGVHLMSVLEKLGIADAIKAKRVTPPLGTRIGTLVARGDAEIGVQQITELLLIPGIDYVGPLPQELQANIVYSLATPTFVRQVDAAQELIKFLKSEAALPVMKKLGLEPA